MKRLILTLKGELLLVKGSDGYRLPTENEVNLATDSEKFQFGDFLASSLENVTGATSGNIERRGLRESWTTIPDEEYYAASKAMELLNWNSEERYCCKDGENLERHSEISKLCPKCGTEYFPRLSPAIVVLVKRGDEALLVHAKTLRNPVMALVAGFVETGESLEECVAREVKEETSLEIDNIRYYGSQSWPFPHQLMVGFTAEYRSGEVSFADGELTSGGFFTRDKAPAIPSMPSLSRMIINAWLNGEI